MSSELFGLGRTWWFGVTVVLGMTILTAVGETNFGQWWEVTRWIATVVIGGKTVEKIGIAVASGRSKTDPSTK